MIRGFFETKEDNWYGYNGNLFMNALSNTNLDSADLVIRESLQNSYDARISERVPVDFTIHGYSLSERNSDFLKHMLERCNSESSISFSRSIHPGLFCIEIHDRNAVGLNGPYQKFGSRNEEIPTSEGKSNYRDFVWSMGGSKGSNSGGSFGVGKTSLFIISRIKTVCIYSRTLFEGRYQSRFIIKRFCKPNNDDSTPYIQFWYGDYRNEGDANISVNIPKPFLDGEADEIARSLGLSVYQGSDTGTTSLILDVSFPEVSDKSISSSDLFRKRFPEIITKWFWTKLSGNVPLDKQISIHLQLENESIDIPDFSADLSSPYFYFNRCLEIWRSEYHKMEKLSQSARARSEGTDHFIPVKMKRPALFLGAITYVTASEKELKKSEFFNDGNLCIVFMRNVEFCLKYKTYPCLSIPAGKLIFALFHVDPDGYNASDPEDRPGSIDQAFRLAEDSSHENWSVSASKNYKNKSYVRVALKRIDEILLERFDSEIKTSATAVSSMLTAELGQLLPAGFGTGGNLRIGQAGSPSQPKERVTKLGTLQFSSPKIIGVPMYLDRGIRQIRCKINVNGHSANPWRVIPYVRTIDGQRLQSDKISVIKIEYFQKYTPNAVGISVARGDRLAMINRSGDYVVTVETSSDVDFDLKFEEEK